MGFKTDEIRALPDRQAYMIRSIHFAIQVADFFVDVTAINVLMTELGGMILPSHCHTSQDGCSPNSRRVLFEVTAEMQTDFWKVCPNLCGDRFSLCRRLCVCLHACIE